MPLVQLGLVLSMLGMDFGTSTVTQLTLNDTELGLVTRFPFGIPADITIALAGGDEIFTFAWAVEWSVALWIPIVFLMIDLVLLCVHITKYKNLVFALILLVLSLIELVTVVTIKLLFWNYLSTYFSPYYSGRLLSTIYMTYLQLVS